MSVINFTLKPFNKYPSPRSIKEIEEWISRHENPEIREHLNCVAAMTWNLAAQLSKIDGADLNLDDEVGTLPSPKAAVVDVVDVDVDGA